jgi:NAD kinase
MVAGDAVVGRDRLAVDLVLDDWALLEDLPRDRQPDELLPLVHPRHLAWDRVAALAHEALLDDEIAVLASRHPADLVVVVGDDVVVLHRSSSVV